VHHALAAGDARVAGDLVWRNVAAQVADGQPAAVERWLSRFSELQLARQPRLALAAAGCELLRGQGHMVRHWAAAAADAPRPAGSSDTVDIGGALLHAASGVDGLVRMRDDARAARARLPAGNAACAALAGYLEGVASQLLGDDDTATRRLEEAARDAAVRAPHVHALCLAALATTVALERADWDEAAELSGRARAQADRHRLRDTPASALVFAVSAVARAHRGRIQEAREDLELATRLHAGLTDFAPWYEAEIHILLARAALRLSDVCLAREHLKAATRVLRHMPDAIVLARWRDATKAQLETFTPPDGAQLEPMTAAELRVLHYLPTHLSFREIGERTQVSANTVKTQANAVYRKFGVACRSDAVTRARVCGLLD
jgi:LuxR family maltose regulon positive regulatory protein